MIHDARARQRRHRAGAAIVLAAAAAGALLLASGGSGAGRGISHRPAHRRPPGRQAAGGAQLRPVVVMRGLRRSAAYAADGSLYVTQQLNAYGLAPVDALWRVSPASGRIRASRPLDGTFSQALMASGSLWVTSTSGARSWLWRLDPASLAVDERLLLGSNGDGSGEAAPTLTAAGGWLWIGDLDRLIRVSSATGAVTETIHVPGAGGIGVASNPSGGVLLDSEGRQIAHIQRRDPRTGRLLRQSAPIGSVSFPYVGGVYGDSVWVSNATGMAGYVQRFSLATLKPTRFAGAKPHPGVTMPAGDPRGQRHQGADARRDPMGHPAGRRAPAQLLRQPAQRGDPCIASVRTRGAAAHRRGRSRLLRPERASSLRDARLREDQPALLRQGRHLAAPVAARAARTLCVWYAG